MTLLAEGGSWYRQYVMSATVTIGYLLSLPAVLFQGRQQQTFFMA
jgi:hypothetical protein